MEVEPANSGLGPSDLDRDRQDELADAFMGQRRRLISLAYRLTGSVADADDVAQETWVRLQRADADAATSPRDLPAWVTTTATRLALDQLRRTRRRRETYVGPWLPEPYMPASTGVTAGDPSQVAVLADELSFALMVVLDALSPAERAAFILHDTFGVPFEEVAAALGRTPAGVRQLASRARNKIRTHTQPTYADPSTHRQVIDAFVTASQGGDLRALAAVLDPTVVYRADGGGLVTAAVNVVTGAERVARLVIGIFGGIDAAVDPQIRLVNGKPGLAFIRDDDVVAVVAFDVATSGRIVSINVQMNPDKLAVSRPRPR